MSSEHGNQRSPVGWVSPQGVTQQAGLDAGAGDGFENVGLRCASPTYGAEWREVKLGECIELFTGFPFKSADYSDASDVVRLLRGDNIGQGLLRWDGVKMWPSDKCSDLSAYELKEYDVVIAMDRPWIPAGLKFGKVRKSDLPALLVQRVSRLRPQSIITANYLYYIIASREFTQYIQNVTTGTAVPHISAQQIKDYQFRLPDLIVQTQASEILAALDDRITLLRETNVTLEAIAQALFKSWFVDFDPVRARMEGREPDGVAQGGANVASAGCAGATISAETAALFPDAFEESELGLIPKGWKVGKVADIGEVICGKTPPTSDPANYGDDVPFITIPDMHNFLAVTSTNRSLSTLGANTQKKKTLPAGSICISCIATAGLVVRVTTPSQTNQQINSVVPFPKWGKSFPLFTLRRIGDAVRAGGSGGSVFHNLNKSGFEKLHVLFSSEHLAMAFDAVVEPLIEKIIANQKQEKTLTNLRDTLLPRLISGQLRLPEAVAAFEEAV